MSVAPLNHLFSPEFEARLLELMMQTHTPGCGVSLVGGHDDGTWEEVVKVYGTAKDDQPVTPDTRFPIASNTKLFTVLALAELLEKHALTFETRIKDILPEFQLVDKVTENLSTINDFCCHMTGIPGYSFAYAKGLTREDVLELFRSHQPSTSFRQTMGFQYNNQAYDILGLVIERLSGVSYTDYIRQTFFEPLGMRTAGFGWDEHTATGHWTGRRGDTVEIPGAVTGVPACQSSGGVVASAVDMVKWLKFIASHPGYQQASTPRSIDHGWADVWNFPYSSSVTTYGAGLFQCTYHDTSVHEHWGALNGFRVILSWVPSAKVGMFIVVNGYQGEDILNLLKMTVLDRVTGGVEHGTDEWLKRIASERAIKQARLAIGMSPVKVHESSPLIGKYTCPSVFTFHLEGSSNTCFLPECEPFPYLPHLYGDLKPLLAYAGQGKYKGCLVWTYKGKQYYGYPSGRRPLRIGRSSKYSGCPVMELELTHQLAQRFLSKWTDR